jgi:hypothetical protein
MRESYRLPDGSNTNNLQEYLNKWGAIVDRLTKELDLISIGFDPSFLVYAKIDGRDTRSIDMPTWFVMRILDAIDRNG